MVIVSLLSEKIKNFCDLQKDDPLLSRLRKKYPDVSVVKRSDPISGSEDHEEILCFDDDWKRSLETLNMILENVNHLKEQYFEILDNSKSNDVYFKTIDNLIIRLKKMMERSQDACKVSERLSKDIQATIIKNFNCEQLERVLDMFMNECGFKRVEFKIGAEIDDNDWAFIDINNCIYEDVPDKKMHNTIIDKIYDTYIFKYYDSEEEECYNRVISGNYTIGRWKE